MTKRWCPHCGRITDHRWKEVRPFQGGFVRMGGACYGCLARGVAATIRRTDSAAEPDLGERSPRPDGGAR